MRGSSLSRKIISRWLIVAVDFACFVAPLIVQLLKSVSEQPEFEANKESGKITKKEITKLRRCLTKNSGRPYSSVDHLVKQVYSSWLTLYQKRKKQKEGKEYFLNHILKSDIQLVEESNCDLLTIRSKAQEILSNPKAGAKSLGCCQMSETRVCTGYCCFSHE